MGHLGCVASSDLLHCSSVLAPSDILVWVQSTIRRDPDATIRSIERSDIGKRFILHQDRASRSFPGDYPALQEHWTRAWKEMVEVALVRKCTWILRLEDDIEVNKHILYNLCTWEAPKSSLFAFGSLFVPDYWLERPELFLEDPETWECFRNIRDIEGAQGQFIHRDSVLPLLEKVPHALQERGEALSFDWSLSRAAWQFGKRVFIHRPSLVTNLDTSRFSTIDLEQHKSQQPQESEKHYWGSASFKETWKRS